MGAVHSVLALYEIVTFGKGVLPFLAVPLEAVVTAS